jgi:hypothetical protein
LELKSAEVIPPQIVLDEEVQIPVYSITRLAERVSVGLSSYLYRKRLWINTRCQLFQAYVLSSLMRLSPLLIPLNIRSGGDTEVDVNDVAFALEKVIEKRKAEDTWQVDSFGGVPVKSRTPDEVILAFFSWENFRHLLCHAM